MSECALCRPPRAETVLWSDGRCRAILADEPGYPGFCRVVWNDHRAEMTDLGAEEQHRLLAVVLAVEGALREVMKPDKVNLASLGNRVPHVHWHVIPRFRDDPSWPDAGWAPAVRAAPAGRLPPDPARLA
ncbi:MAG: HIT family protein, partial [Deltaproteobacteria bacterium]|nr:HIT family protein [Deltaproteobacteria bacterium]